MATSTRRPLLIPPSENDVELKVGSRRVRLTNLGKLFWPAREGAITKRDLLQYYADVSPWLLPHLRDRAMVMKRYPNGANGKWFLMMKRVPVDYSQNAWGRTLASVYSPRPKPLATVSTPLTWKEVEQGVRIEDFHIGNVPARLRRLGDLWKPLVTARGRFRLERVL